MLNLCPMTLSWNPKGRDPALLVHGGIVGSDSKLYVCYSISFLLCYAILLHHAFVDMVKRHFLIKNHKRIMIIRYE